MNVATAEAEAVKFLTRVKCALCSFVAIVEHSAKHPHCPECGGPTKLETRAFPVDAIVTERVESNVKEAIRDLGGKVAAVESELTDAEREIVARFRRGEVGVIKAPPTTGQLDTSPPANATMAEHAAAEVAHSSQGPTIVRDPEPGDLGIDLPPGSA